MSVSEIRSICESLRFPQEAQAAFAAAYEALCTSGDACHMMETNSALFWQGFYSSTGSELKNLDLIADLTGIHKYTVYELFYLMNYGKAEMEYRIHGLSDQIFHDSMMELNYKMLITHNIYGVWGSAFADWYSGFFRQKVICLGRLEFELIESFIDYTNGGYIIRKGDPVINVHIPEAGPLKPELFKEAFGKAAEFFNDCFCSDAIPFVCLSWLLYPPVVALCPEGNLKSFAACFDVVDSIINTEHDDRWRIFQVPPDMAVEDYPEDTTLQRSLKKWLLAGNTMGCGEGILFLKNGEVLSHRNEII